jgi:hypothetical protein
VEAATPAEYRLFLRRILRSPTRFAVDGNQPVRTAVVVPNRVGDPILKTD